MLDSSKLLKECAACDTKLHLMVKLQFRIYVGGSEVHIHCHYSQVHSDRERKYLLGSHLRVE